MTIKDYIESAKMIKRVAQEYLGEYFELYELSRFDSGNIVFEIHEHKKREILELIPNETNNFIMNIQFCYCNGKWQLCSTHTITNVGIYKKHKGWIKESEETE